MDTPGVSIFQEGETMKINSTLDRETEAEMLEDQKRREKELGALLENGFDDLDDYECTIDSTENFQSDLLPTHQEHNFYQDAPHEKNTENETHGACETEIHKLKMLLESRTHEVEHFKQLINEEHGKGQDLEKRLNITEAELERVLIEKSNTHELLVDSKEKCSNQDNIISKLRNEKKLLETENSELSGKLETVQTLLAELQLKYDLVERDFHRRDDRNAEMRIKQLEERQRAQTDLLEQQINHFADQNERKQQELDSLTARYNAAQSSHEHMLLDKAGKINELNNALGEAQRKCGQLLAKPNYELECQRLQKLITHYQAQIASMEQTITTLNERLNITSSELDLMESVLQQHNVETSPRRLSQTQGRLVGSTPQNTGGRIGQMRDELYRALANLKSKRDEVRKLQITLEGRNLELHTLREEENKSLVLISTLKEDKSKLENRIKALIEEIESVVDQNQTLNNSKLQNLRQELCDLRQERDSLQEQCIELTSVRDHQDAERKKICAQLKNVEVELEEFKQEHESMKHNYEQIILDNRNLRARNTADSVRLELERHKILLKDAQSECDRLKQLFTDITNAKEALSYELEKLRTTDVHKQLCQQSEKVAHLQRTLQLAEMKASELTKIMDTEKLCHERELAALREKHEREKTEKIAQAVDACTKNCNKCIDSVAEITKFEIQILKLNNLNTAQKREIDKLHLDLKQSQSQIAELQTKLQLSEQQECLISELKQKATQFEDYIKTQSSSSGVSTSSPKSPTAVVSTSEKATCTPTQAPNVICKSPEMSPSVVKKIEARIRDEMAQIFAAELKRFQAKLQQTEQRSIVLQREYQHVCTELQQRQIDVELLKQAILAEREKIDEILSRKDNDCKDILQKQKSILQKCRNELQMKNERITELVKELQERQTQIEAERHSMKVVMSQWEAQRKSVDSVEHEWRAKLKELHTSHDVTMQAMLNKYNSAKRTAHNYKRYAEDKEAHMLREYDRLKHEYDISVAQMEVRITETLERKSREMLVSMSSRSKQPVLDKEMDKENKPTN